MNGHRNVRLGLAASTLCVALVLGMSGCEATRDAAEGGAAPRVRTRQTPTLLAVLPECVTTPDGMAIDAEGNLIVACPNYADQSKPACLIKIARDTKVTKWVDVPVLPETGVACPMGIQFGPDGDLYVCDNQGWTGSEKGAFKGRMLRLRIQDNKVVKTTAVAEGMEHPNGCRVRNGFLYVTQSLMTKVKDPTGLMVSAVYRFKLDDENVKVNNTLDDKNIITTLLTRNKNCQYGADGIVFDSKGNLFIGNFGDGALHKVTFDKAGNVTANTIFAKTDLDYSLDPKAPGFLAKATLARMRTTDGICVDDKDNIYVADFSNNAVARARHKGEIVVIAQNGDTDGRKGELNEPGEPIVWNGMIVVSNFDAVFGPNHPDKVNTKHDAPCTMSALRLR
ncbi:MAG: phage head-tail adapter protein [Planctomycetota bacterium]|nr:phage head-tail adapter protein [Planctomycetota bacterium]